MKRPPIKINIITIIKIIKAIRKYLKQLKQNKMCFRNLFHSNNPDATGKLPALAFAINDYKGSENDLNGCIDDQVDSVDLLEKYYPQYYFRTFRDYEVTINKFKSELTKAIAEHLGVPVLFISDSCYSGSNTRGVTKNRFKPNPWGCPAAKSRRSKLFLKENQIGNWISISGCGENQTSADAVFNGRYNGACTKALLTVLENACKKGLKITYKEWVTAGNAFLEMHDFVQKMTIEGPDELINKIVFEDPIIPVLYSGHGTNTRDRNGDEVDGYDEALYVWDGLISDDDMNEILSHISK